MKHSKQGNALSKGTEKIDNIDYSLLENKGFFKINIDNNLEYARISWNSDRCDIVAIDGQHRLAALKRMHGDDQFDGLNWKIPIVLLIFEKIDGNTTEQTISILETVRRTFVNINEKSEHINKCRKILLDDSDLNAICVQELVQVSHSNDNKNFKDREESILPLIFFEWRGVVKNRRPQPNPASVKEIVEIKNWFEFFLIGTNTKEQKDNLMLDDMPHGAPESLAENKILTPRDVAEIRKYLREDFIKGLNNFLINFTPLKKYIEGARKIEKDALTKDEHGRNDIRKQAFLKFRFGKHNTLGNIIQDEVDIEYGELTRKYEELKNRQLPKYIKIDIGMRGVIYAFGELKRIFDKHSGRTNKWLEYSNEVIEYFNMIFEEGWFKEHDDESIETKKREFLTYIMYNNVGSVQQYYKLENMNKQLGGFLIILLLSKMRHYFNWLNTNLSEIIEDYRENISESYEKGFKSAFKSKHRNEYVSKELTKKANIYADEQSKNLIKKLFDFLGMEEGVS